jgi:hypothetical protein
MRSFSLLLAAVLLSTANCSCDDEVVHAANTCDLRSSCGASKIMRHGVCAPERCTGDGDCCAGERCGAGGKCGPVEDRCRADEDCSEAGFYCIEEEGKARCRRPRCATASDCPLGSCFERRCVIEPPCLAGCEAGSFCDVQSGKCLQAPVGGEGCDQSCKVGQRLMLEDPQTMRGALCCAARCECRDLPDIAPRDIGLYLDAAELDGSIAVAAYERHFGDLVFMKLATSGALELLEFVDGFPQPTEIAGRADGPRGGALEPGVDSGRFPSLAIVGGEPQIAYQRADDGMLMYAWRNQGVWTTVTVDSSGGTGYEPDLVIDAQGRPHIAYWTRLSGDQTALKYAVADRPSPDHPNHFHLLTVSAADSCIDGCGEAQACVRDETGERCLPLAEGCENCGGGNACVLDQELACEPLAHRVGAVSGASLGHAPQLLLRPDASIIVFGDRQTQTLRLAQVVGGRTQGIFTLDGDGLAENALSGGLGRSHAAMFDAAGQLVVFYRDETSQAVRRYQGSIDGAGERRVIDDGRGISDEPGGLDRVQGSDLSVLLSGDKEYAVFQDQSMGDVSAWIAGERRQIRSQLLDGFSARVVLVGEQPYAVHGGVRTDRDGVSRFGVVVVGLQ